MIDIFWYYVVTLIFLAFLSTFLSFYRFVLHNKYIDAEKRLRLKLNEANSYFKGTSEKAPDFIQNAIGDMGVQGIADELGIDLPGILKNPLVKGLVEKYAPRVIEQLSKGGKLAGSKSSEVELL